MRRCTVLRAAASTPPPCRTSARKRRVSPGAVYVYFASKEDLIAGLCERDRNEFAERFAQLADAPDFLEALRGIGEHYFVDESPDRQRFVIEMGVESTRNPRIAEIFMKVDRFCCDSFEVAVPALEGRGPHCAARRYCRRSQKFLT